MLFFNKRVFDQNNKYYVAWEVFLSLVCTFSAFAYCYAAQFFVEPPGIRHPLVIYLIITEVMVLFDIILGFFKGYYEPGEKKDMIRNFDKTFDRHFYSNTLKEEIFVFIPWGAL